MHIFELSHTVYPIMLAMVKRGGTYLSSELTVVKMYTLFLELLYPDKYAEYRAGTDVKKINCEVKFRFYYDYFKENFNYGFGRPRSDVCCECTELQAKINVTNVTAISNILGKSAHKIRSLSRRLSCLKIVQHSNFEESFECCGGFFCRFVVYVSGEWTNSKLADNHI